MGELGLVHRHELSGALHGLMRVRCFTQDDAHIFMTPDQIKDEIKGVVKPDRRGLYHALALTYHVELSTTSGGLHGQLTRTGRWRPTALHEALDELGNDVCDQRGRRRVLRPEDRLPSGRTASDVPGSAAPFSWTSRCPSASSWSTPAQDGEKHRPVMIHRVCLRLHRALHRHPHRALCRRVPDVAGSGAGQGSCR